MLIQCLSSDPCAHAAVPEAVRDEIASHSHMGRDGWRGETVSKAPAMP